VTAQIVSLGDYTQPPASTAFMFSLGGGVEGAESRRILVANVGYRVSRVLGGHAGQRAERHVRGGDTSSRREGRDEQDVWQAFRPAGAGQPKGLHYFPKRISLPI